MTYDMVISSDYGLQWGNITITPSELASLIKGITIKSGLMVLDGVKFWNDGDDSYIADQDNVRHKVMDLYLRVEESGNISNRQ